jgi:hypothetical protein
LGQPQSFFLKSPQRKPFLRLRFITVLDSVEEAEMVVFLRDTVFSACVSNEKQEIRMEKRISFFIFSFE